MTELSERTKANMDVVLEETCRQLPHGGDHDSRRFIAERLIEAAQSGHSTLGELGIVARRALAEIAGKNGCKSS
ncbi:hypothetical protein [Bradyrhizobium sp. AS23.2]|uniref:hypothetical protein n=1 Tax=Bradyrhizobium sp. AS23.2 TaxID=1680155 RepID=UPI001FD9E6E2|nr:hypothetical protein [Bradyrhizobium sp. AS23.2]